MANRNSTFLLKRSNVSGKVPALSGLTIGELALNVADSKLYSLYTGGLTGATEVREIGWDRLSVSGGTLYGNLDILGTLSATSIHTNYIDFNTGSTVTNKPGRIFYDSDSESLVYNSNISPNTPIKIGQQLFTKVINNTGSLIPKGSAVKIQSSYNDTPEISLAIANNSGNNQVVGLVAEDIPNTKIGLVLNQGILSGTSISHPVGSILYLSDTTPGGLISSTSSLSYSSRTNQIGYTLASGTTNGVIYVSINNENLNLSLTDIERNILEGNTISTGAFRFTGLTKTSSTTFDVAPVLGWIVKNTYNYATLPDVTLISYSGATGQTTPYINTDVVTYILITSGSTLLLQSTYPTPQERRENIFLGRITHPDKTSIVSVNNTIDFDVSPMSALRDLWSPLKLINEGVIASPNGANLRFNTSSGTLWGNGVGFATNELNPNSVSISGSSPVTFQYRVQTGGTYSDTTLIDPTRYDNNGILTLVGGASNSSTNQRIYLFPDGLVRVQYGQQVYPTLTAAIAGVQTENFITFSNNRDNAVLIGILSVNKNAADLSNSTQAVFNFVSKFGEVLGGTGGLSTTTLQQAYNNSTTPEIVINSILGGLSIKNGTGNSDNTTHLLEGINSSNVITSIIRADGYISGSTFQTNGFISNSNGLSATTISGSTFYGNGTNLIGIISGGSFSGSTLILNRNGSSDITITGFTNGGSVSGDYLPISGGTIKGDLTVTGNTTLSSTTATTLYTNYIDFNTNATTTTQFGRINWDSGTGTLNIGIGDSTTGLVDFQVGQEEVVRVFNSEATTLTAGTIVYVSGSQGNRPSVKRALATSDGYSVTTLGMVDTTILSGSEGYVTTFGMINNLNTLGLTGGTPIWLSPTIPGGYTATKPKAPDHTVLLGYVVRIHASVGSIFVNISNGWEIDELHDVRLNGRTHGDLLVYSGYNGYDVWTNSKTLTGDYTINGGLTITGTTSGGTFYGSGIGLTNIPISGVTDLQTNLNNKFDKSGGTISGDVTINGNLVVNGTATTINTETILVKDNIITLNSNYSGNTSPFNGNSGIEVLRGSGTTSTLLWDESNNYWVAGLSGSTKRVILSGDSLSLLTSGHTHTISDITNLPSYSSSINDKFGVVTATTIGDDFNTGIKISQTPRGYVDVSVNGLSVSVGDGVTTSDCYFSSNGTSGGVRYFTGITTNDFFMWNTTISGYELDSGDTISFYYIIQN